MSRDFDNSVIKRTLKTAGFSLIPPGRSIKKSVHPGSEGYRTDAKFEDSEIGDVYAVRLVDSPYFVFDIDVKKYPEEINSGVYTVTKRGFHFYWRCPEAIPEGLTLKSLHPEYLPEYNVEIKKGGLSLRKKGQYKPSSFITGPGSLNAKGDYLYKPVGDFLEIPTYHLDKWRCLYTEESEARGDKEGYVPEGTEAVAKILNRLDYRDYPVDDSEVFGRLCGAIMSDCDNEQDAIRLIEQFYKGNHSRVGDRVTSFAKGSGSTIASLRYDLDKKLTEEHRIRAVNGILVSKAAEILSAQGSESDIQEVDDNAADEKPKFNGYKVPEPALKDITGLFSTWDYDMASIEAVHKLNEYIALDLTADSDKQILMRRAGVWVKENFSLTEKKLAPCTTQSKKRDVSAFSLWVSSSFRRTTVNPKRYYGRDVPEGSIDLWDGFAYEPEDGCCEPFINIIKNSLCSGEEEQYNYLLDWTAHLVQNPGVKIRTAITLKGLNGTGKSLFHETIKEMCGTGFAVGLNGCRISSQFNADLDGKGLIVLSEYAYDPRKPVADYSELKGLISDDYTTIEGKGVNRDSNRKSHSSIILSLNNSSNFFIDPAERRFFFPDVSDKYYGDHNTDALRQFSDLIEWRDKDNGRAKLLGYLLNRQVSRDFRTIPYTKTRITYMTRGMNDATKAVTFMVCEGVLEDQKIWDEDGGANLLTGPALAHAAAIKDTLKDPRVYMGYAGSWPLWPVRKHRYQDIPEDTMVLVFPPRDLCIKLILS